MTDIDTTEEWRAAVEDNLRKWDLERRAAELELKTKQALLRAAAASPLRAAKYNRKGADFNESGKQVLNDRCAQLTFDIEVFDSLIAGAEEELATLSAHVDEE